MAAASPPRTCAASARRRGLVGAAGGSSAADTQPDVTVSHRQPAPRIARIGLGMMESPDPQYTEKTEGSSRRRPLTYPSSPREKTECGRVVAAGLRARRLLVRGTEYGGHVGPPLRPHLYCSRGTATFPLPLRICHQSDITLVSNEKRRYVTMIREEVSNGGSGLGMLLLFLALFFLSGYELLVAGFGLGVLGSVLTMILSILGLAGLFVVNPNEAKVLQLFGDYRGTVRKAGLRWANPFYSKKKISVRTRNFETGKLKVNDKTGNPIEIAAVVVWKVVDTAEALFNVDDYINFVHVQSESALRNLATH